MVSAFLHGWDSIHSPYNVGGSCLDGNESDGAEASKAQAGPINFLTPFDISKPPMLLAAVCVVLAIPSNAGRLPEHPLVTLERGELVSLLLPPRAAQVELLDGLVIPLIDPSYGPQAY